MTESDTAPLAVAILAGGSSRRMGRDKSLLPLAGQPLLARVIERCAQLQVEMFLVSNQPTVHQQFGLPMVGDVLPGAGALGGLYTALLHSPAPDVLCVACDMPYLNPSLLNALAQQRSGVDGVVPVIAGQPEPLHAVYNRACLPAIRAQIAAGDLRITGFYDQVRLRYVDESWVRRLDPELRSFVNLNTPADLDAAT